MDMVNIKINGMSYEVAAGSTILEAAREAGIDIPTLCFLKDVNQIGACRMCMVRKLRAQIACCRLRVPRKRGHGGLHQYAEGSEIQKK